MKTVILYYTFGGSTKKEAERLAAEQNAPVCRVKEAHSRGFLAAFIPGGLQARQRKASAIRPIDSDLRKYDRIIIGCPVWAGYPAPAFNAILSLLPPGKEVEVYLCSAGGDSQKSAQGTKDLIAQKGCTLVSYRDVRTNTPPGKMKE